MWSFTKILPDTTRNLKPGGPEDSPDILYDSLLSSPVSRRENPALLLLLTEPSLLQRHLLLLIPLISLGLHLPRLEEAQAGIKIAGRKINNLRYSDTTTLTAESEEELKTLLMKVKEESETVGLKISIQKTNIMASSPITSWQIDGETVETVANFILGGAPKSLQMVTAAMKLKDAFSLEGKL